MVKRLLYLTGLLLLVVTLTFLPRGVLLGKGTARSQGFQHHSTANVIDGSVHPELIPDRDAFRLFFLAAATSTNATTDEKKRQRAMFSSAGFNENELAAASTILVDYKTQYEQAIQQYNDAVALARSPDQLPDGKKLVAELNMLTTTAQAKLESSISGKSARHLYEHVQHEKSRMRVAE